MAALVQTNSSRFVSLKMIETQSKPIESPSPLRVRPVRAVSAHEPRAFPEASIRPTLPTAIRDEMLEFYAFVFCQGGFRQVGMTFEQFLLVVAAVKPADLPATREETRTHTFELIPLDAA
jgi:hypothetical protein